MKLFLPAIHVLAYGLLTLAGLMAVPALLSLVVQSGNTRAFVLPITLSLVSALVMLWYCRQRADDSALQPRQMFLVTVLVWVVIPVYASLPFLLIENGLSVTDAVFETVSGMTTTGSTVITGLDQLSLDVLIWRSCLQWFGGIGIITLAVAVLPFLRVGGMRLFRTESSEWSDRGRLRAHGLLKRILLTYCILTLLCAAVYLSLGMDPFNAINHAMTSISTGGYSTSDASFGQFKDLSLIWAATFSMIAGGIPFGIYVHALHERNIKVFSDTQIKTFVSIIFVTAFVLSLVIESGNGNDSWWQKFSHAAFNVASVITTTGYASMDYSLWGEFAILVFFFITFVGGCSGSTSGGVKIFRVQLSLMLIRDQVFRAIHPKVVLRRQYNGHPVNDEVYASLIAFLFLLALSWVMISLLMALSGLDMLTSLSGAATALMNVGPGLGSTIGPAGTFQSIPDVAKWVLCVGMILGRLEFMAVLVILSRRYWVN